MSERVERILSELATAVREEVGSLPDNILTLGEEIRAARAWARLSLQGVADRSGYTKSHVWEVEKGRSRNPTVGMIAGLSKALGVPFLRLSQAALNSLEQGECLPADGPLGGQDGSSSPNGMNTKTSPRGFARRGTGE